jgi:hypothetical protein
VIVVVCDLVDVEGICLLASVQDWSLSVGLGRLLRKLALGRRVAVAGDSSALGLVHGVELLGLHILDVRLLHVGVSNHGLMRASLFLRLSHLLGKVTLGRSALRVRHKLVSLGDLGGLEDLVVRLLILLEGALSLGTVALRDLLEVALFSLMVVNELSFSKDL